MSKAMLPHVLIRASAGSGKTHQLTNRYLRLIAAGVEPHAILATTFTRKAAGEILDRVLHRLAAAAADARHAATLGEQLGGVESNPDYFVGLLRRLLRQLHRVRISTLDSFYVALAGCFAHELGLPAGWTICEETDDAVMRREALDRLLHRQPDDITRLFALLTKGDSKRSIHADLESTVSSHYAAYRGSPPDAWTALLVPQLLPETERRAVLEQLQQFDMSKCGHKSFATTRDADVDRFLRSEFQKFMTTGLAAKVISGDLVFYKKPIPTDAAALYEKLLQDARHQLLKPIADQNRATWELLDHYHGELWALKQAHGSLRFDEVTRALVEATTQKVLPAEALAFRLDGAIEHLLLDEFQDTSLAQWRVVQPIAQSITDSAHTASRSFFCVGDVKQAIYGWRGGLSAIFDLLPTALGDIHQDKLVESRRSAQPIIDVVNQVFGNLDALDVGDKNVPGVAAWSNRFDRHSTVHKDLPGYVRLESGPAQLEAEALLDQRGRHCAYVAARIRDLVTHAPGRSIGVLCRGHDILARMIFELRQLHVVASEEGGNTLADSAAVELVLSLLTLADHPGDTVAWFHLRHSLLGEHIDTQAGPRRFARQLRRDLQAMGYGLFVFEWAKRLVPACDRRELMRLQQLVEMAFAYQVRSTLRADDFVAWVRTQRTPDPAAADVRVMTMHGAKGLEFDVVVLPELDAGLVGRTPAFVVGRDAALDTNFVCRYVDESIRSLMQNDERGAFELWRRERVEESLSLLYVAMTRAIHALYMYVPGERTKERKDGWYQVLCQTLARETARGECALLFEKGSAHDLKPTTKTVAEAASTGPIAFQPPLTQRQRGLERVAPSKRAGGEQIAASSLFDPKSVTGTSVGTLFHAWFAMIDWLDDEPPTDDQLRQMAQTLDIDFPGAVLFELDSHIRNFRDALSRSEIKAVLSRSTIADRASISVERERRFAVRDGSKLLGGSIDRIVWHKDGPKVVAAEILDFKTDTIPDDATLSSKTNHYSPQMESYRRAVSLMAHIPVERIALRLVFTSPGRVIPL